MSDEGIWHTVEPGDSVTSLAFAHGMVWQTVWNHAQNSDLRKLRKRPNILLPGDRVFIPDIRVHQADGATDAKHKFVRIGVPEKLAIQFLDFEGNPHANENFVLDIDGQLTNGSLDGQGWLHLPVSPNARAGHIDIGPAGELVSCDLHLGHMDPIDTLTGVAARLHNLGYYDGSADVDESSEQFKLALMEFRKQEELPVSSQGIDDALRDALEKRHGS